eukprot:12676967-Heterocapsa_arctica.AAC.1
MPCFAMRDKRVCTEGTACLYSHDQQKLKASKAAMEAMGKGKAAQAGAPGGEKAKGGEGKKRVCKFWLAGHCVQGT